MQETQLNGESLDIVSENIFILKKLFPEIVTENKIDFDKLKLILSDYCDTDIERYNFTWKGKMNTLSLAQVPSFGTIRPFKEESKDWDKSKNLYIEGDNLEILKLLQKSYYGKIKMIYIDPPYNTGREFIYPDDYKDNIKNYLYITGQIDSVGMKISTNADYSGRYHTNWLNMFYPRLKLAKNLLNDSGVIFVSIDDNEIVNTLKICNEIFGEENVDVMIWRKSGVGRDGKMKNTTTFRKDHEYIVVCFKNTHFLNKSFEKPNWENIYGNPDNDPRGGYKAGSISRKEEASNSNHINYYSVISPSGKKFTRQFDVSKEIFLELDNDNRIYWGKKGDAVPAIKIFQNEKRQVTTSSMIIEKDEYINSSTINDSDCTTTKGSKELEDLLSIKGLGNEMRPKPTDLIKKLIQIGTHKEDIVLDFFSGSATTADATMQLNVEDNGNRKFIMVQLPEPTSDKDQAYKAGFENICEIGKERIRRAGDKIVSEMSQNGQTSLDSKSNTDLDIGFKVFKLDSSNLSKWNPEFDNLEQTLLDSVENLVPGRSELDLVYEIMLKYGIDLTLPIEEYQTQDKKFYSIGFGALIICLDDNLTSNLASEIIKLKDELSPEVMRVVFKDNGFASDSDKTNIKETLKTNGIEEFVTI